MNWIKSSSLTPGDQIRVNRGNIYYHHGIYIGDNNVIHFSATNEDGLLNSKNVFVRIDSLNTFLKHSELEIAIYSDDELNNLYSKEEIINRAKASLGESGYDLFRNNCEHFSNRCAFKTHQKNQYDEMRERIRKLIK